MPTVELSSQTKVLFPEDGLTKADLAGHYATVAGVMLPHVRERPLSLQVFPGGIGQTGHFLKQIPDYFPNWIARAEMPKHGGTVTHVVANDADSLRMLAQHNAITPHVPTARVDLPDRPDRLIVDFDPPDESWAWGDVVQGAKLAGDRLRAADMVPYVMTTGSRGLHVVAPLRREVDYDAVTKMAKDLAAAVVEARSGAFTTAFKKEKREGRIFVDVLRNRPAQTAVAPYAVRALDGAPVATPLEWNELDDPGLSPQGWSMTTIADRLATVGDPWDDFSEAAVSPRTAAKKLAS